VTAPVVPGGISCRELDARPDRDALLEAFREFKRGG
jgi:hypothetical protein